MAILIRPPGRHFKKRKSETAQQVLERLEKYLNENTEKPVEILCGFWKDQQDAITYQELREAVKAGYLDETVFRDWTQDYSVMMLEKMIPIWTASMEAGALAQPIIEPLKFSFDTQTPGVLNWINTRGGNFVTSCTRDQRQAIAALLQKKITEQYTIDELARLIRPCIGLTKDQAKATSRLYNHVKATLEKEHPRMKKESIRRKAMDTAVKYAEKQHRQRAFTIAQTEMAFAYNRGADEGVRQAMNVNLLGTCAKKWCTSGDDQVCPTCAALDGTIIEIDGEFNYKGRVLFPGHKQLPPAHPRCACAVEYIELDPPAFRAKVEQEVEVASKEFETGEAAGEYFGKRPDRSLRRTDREEYDRQLEYYKNQSPFGKWDEALEAKESTSISNYCADDYSAINGLARHQMTKKQVQSWNAVSNQTIEEMIENISSGISKFELPEDIKVFRTCENDVLENLKKKVGSTFHDDGFVSTSVIREKQASGNIFMEITVPKGQGVGAWVSPLSGKPEEYEFLLDRGTDFVVTDIAQDGADTVIRMKVTGNTKRAWSYATKEEVIEQWKRKGIYDEDSTKIL